MRGSKRSRRGEKVFKSSKKAVSAVEMFLMVLVLLRQILACFDEDHACAVVLHTSLGPCPLIAGPRHANRGLVVAQGHGGSPRLHGVLIKYMQDHFN